MQLRGRNRGIHPSKQELCLESLDNSTSDCGPRRLSIGSSGSGSEESKGARLDTSSDKMEAMDNVLMGMC